MVNKIAIAWVDLIFTVRSLLSTPGKRNENIILNQLNGFLEFETITGLMGTNGSGKTVLLKCLNGALNSGLSLDSRIHLSQDTKIRTCFISQDADDHLLQGLQVKECLVYASKLKNSDSVEPVDHERNARALMSELMVSHTAYTECQRCSGGQRKRISIAQELTSVHKPNIMFIDEPTSGLDSESAEVIVAALRDVSRKHKIAIFASIHQPNNEILEMFDRLYVLSKGGSNIYFGPPTDIRRTLRECNIDCADSQTPIEMLMKLSTKGTADKKIAKLMNRVFESQESLKLRCSEETTQTPGGFVAKRKRFTRVDFKHLLIRTSIHAYLVQWKTQLIIPMFSILFALFIGVIMGSDIGRVHGCALINATSPLSCEQMIADEILLRQNLGLMAMSTILFLMFQLVITCLSSSSDMKIFFNEHRNRWYSTGCYFWSKTLVDIVPTLCTSMLYCVIIYHITGQKRELNRFIKFYLTLTLGMFCVQTLCMFFGVICYRNRQLSLIYSAGIFMLLGLFCGFFISPRALGDFLRVFTKLTLARYILFSALIAVYGLNRCPENSISVVLYEFELDNDSVGDYWLYTGVLFVNYVIGRLVTLLALILMSNEFTIQSLFKRQHKKSYSVGYYPRLDSPVHLYENIPGLTYDIKVDDGLSVAGGEHRDPELFEQILPAKKLLIAWIDLSLDVGNKLIRQQNYILNEINGALEIGTINALMGSSGAGKTTLLRCLSGHSNECLSAETQIYLAHNVKIRPCFICQEMREHLLNGLTVRQCLIYASRLKNSSNDAVLVDHNANVSALMAELSIVDIADRSVQNCSGGQQKLIVIASELTSHIKPNLMFVDEPTSGLDSESAVIVIQTLKTLSRRHDMTIVTSIHQPSTELINMFDKLYVLAKGGLNVYAGAPEDLCSYLVDCGIAVNPMETPIEKLMKHSAKGLTDPYMRVLVEKALVKRQPLIDRCADEKAVYSDGIHFKRKPFVAIDLWHLFCRYLKLILRHQLMAKILEIFVFQIFLLIFKTIQLEERNDIDGCVESFGANASAACNRVTEESLHNKLVIESNLKYHFGAALLLLVLVSVSAPVSFNNELTLFFNEHKNGWYSTGVFFIIKNVVDLLLMVPMVLIYCKILDNHSFVRFSIHYMLGALCMQSLGHFVTTIFYGSLETAILFSTFNILTTVMISDIFVNISDMARLFQWLSNIGLPKLLIENVYIIIYGFDRCRGKGLSSVLYKFNLREDHVYTKNIICLILYFISFKILCFVCLVLKANSVSLMRRTTVPKTRLVAIGDSGHTVANIDGSSDSEGSCDEYIDCENK